MSGFSYGYHRFLAQEFSQRRSVDGVESTAMSDLAAILAGCWSNHDAYPTSRDAVLALQVAQRAAAEAVGISTVQLREELLRLYRLGLPREACCQVVIVNGTPIPATA